MKVIVPIPEAAKAESRRSHRHTSWSEWGLEPRSPPPREPQKASRDSHARSSRQARAPSAGQRRARLRRGRGRTLPAAQRSRRRRGRCRRRPPGPGSLRRKRGLLPPPAGRRGPDIASHPPPPAREPLPQTPATGRSGRRGSNLGAGRRCPSPGTTRGTPTRPASHGHRPSSDSPRAEQRPPSCLTLPTVAEGRAHWPNVLCAGGPLDGTVVAPRAPPSEPRLAPPAPWGRVFGSLNSCTSGRRGRAQL